MHPALLHWCTVSPQGPSSLAAIRFAAPVRVSSIRVFPHGAQPFTQLPDIVSETEPDAFYLDVFFNAIPVQPNSQTDSKEKQRAPNALLPTAIAYAGGQMDFTVDIGTEYTTRLMIVKGKFEKLSMAIYGNVISESSPVKTHQPTPLPTLESNPLPKSVDPSNSSDPATTAQKLLTLIEDAPSLSLIVRLMLCLKPTDEDWDDPSFPFLFADLTREDEDFDLESIIQCISHPLADGTSYEDLSKLANRVTDFIGPKNSDQALQIAKILNISASQLPDMAKALLQELDVSSIFDAQCINETTAMYLLHAAANSDIARHFREDDDFTAALDDILDDPHADKRVQSLTRRLLARMNGWIRFEDALSNTRGNFAVSAHFLKDICTQESSVGVWLECMIIHGDINAKLAENPVLPNIQSLPPHLFENPMLSTSHDEFIIFIRALVGICSVLAVWAWADSIGHDECRERALAILQLWQRVDGYREILNHLLLLRQFTRRLGWIATDSDPPRKSGIFAERMLSDLAKDPQAMLRDDLVKTVLSLEQPLAYISENERLSMRKIALVSEDGLSSAAEELAFDSDRPFSYRRLRTLRVSLAIVDRELNDDDEGEWRVIQTFWEEQGHGLVPRLVDIISDIAGDLNQHFVVQSAPTMNQLLAGQLFHTARDAMNLLITLSSSFPLTAHATRTLTLAVADIFACTDLADMIFSQSSEAYVAAQATRQACLDLIHKFTGRNVYLEPSKLGAEVIMRTLMRHATQSSGRDPVYHLLQVFALIDHVLPTRMEEIGQNSHWITSVFPVILSELKDFFRVLDTDNKVHLLNRLRMLDEGYIDIGDWLLIQELKYLSDTLAALAGPISRIEVRLAHQHQVYLSVRFLASLVSPTSSSLNWCIHILSTNAEVTRLLNTCLNGILSGYYSSLAVSQIIHTLAQNASSFVHDTQFSILLNLLRVVQVDPTSPPGFHSILDILKNIPSQYVGDESLRLELGRTLAAYADHATTIDAETADDLVQLLEWLVQQNSTKLSTLCVISLEGLSRLCDALVSLTSPEIAEVITDIRLKISIDEDELFAPPFVKLPESLNLSIQSIQDILDVEGSVPSTPKGTKTPDILGVIISPPSAVLRAHAATGLTKTYANNDFRQLRASPLARLNTSRLPSMHVDDFENVSPTLHVPAPLMNVPDVFIANLLNSNMHAAS
ncbi:hypothetical protein BDQ17DRAFT_1352181 [Cyathus striatus]|nr:hypothetical protein BDQ17DRAFT_1352181 [Cyathus striatus]